MIFTFGRLPKQSKRTRLKLSLDKSCGAPVKTSLQPNQFQTRLAPWKPEGPWSRETGREDVNDWWVFSWRQRGTDQWYQYRKQPAGTWAIFDLDISGLSLWRPRCSCKWVRRNGALNGLCGQSYQLNWIWLVDGFQGREKVEGGENGYTQETEYCLISRYWSVS